MIHNMWYVVLSAKEVKTNQAIGVTRLSQKLVIWRDNKNQICCIADKCCHRGASLCTGKIVDQHIQCPFHGFEYDATGKVTKIPAIGKQGKVSSNFKVQAYHAREAYGFIWVWYGNYNAELPEISFFEELKKDFSYGEFHENWQVHYTRAIENQLDVVHLPFIHKTTIGRGGKMLVNGPVVKWKENLMTYYVKNELDSGQKPERPDEVKEYEKLFSLQLQMPNIWQNRISSKLRVMAAFAPVDEENTMIYLRFYQRFCLIPGLVWAVNHVGNSMNRIILHQDRAVVLTQLPKKSGLKIGENLIQGDLPIIEYRKKREMLQQQEKLDESID